MELNMPVTLAQGYKSACQIARRLSEGWAADHCYCFSCTSDRLRPTAANTQSADFVCPSCHEPFQLKAGKGWNCRSIPDGAYTAMVGAIRNDRTPHLMVMQYSRQWRVHNLMAVPRFLITASAIVKRPPLAQTARRAGWVGCNILLSSIIPEGKLALVAEGVARPKELVRREFQALRPLAALPVSLRGWTLEVLRLARGLRANRFKLADLYEHEGVLATLYPENRNVRAKIRQQLQVLRDLGFIGFEGRGQYAFTL